MVSTGPPAAYGTTMVTARVGQSCAFAEPTDASKSATGAATMVLTMSSSRGLWTLERLLTDVDCPSPIGLAQAASHSRRCGLFRARPGGLA